jgi:hypothetical protein
MTAILCPPLLPSFGKAAHFNDFFETPKDRKIRDLEHREQQIIGAPGESCKTNLFFGFFFDGTKNNYVLAEKGLNHSNVARLYDCYPGLSIPGVLPKIADWEYKPSNFTHFFKTYIPGVASPFKEINDSGAGRELTLGAASGYRGEARIVWALIQAINNVHRYFLKTPLVSAEEAVSLVSQFDLSRASLAGMGTDMTGSISSRDRKTREAFEKILRRLHAAVGQHWPDPTTGHPKKIDPGMVMTIHVAIFGFSRGATQARAFTNWLLALCELDGQLRSKWGTRTLGGFKLEVDFLGLFDTVASVGLGNTLGNVPVAKRLQGHDAWADAHSLRVAEGVRCIHLVAAHEIRRSFPLDSIAVGKIMPAGCEEVVFPGVHSDLGCGYSPCEQGRGVDPTGADMLARLPLLYMYKWARIAGVPLKLEFASEAAKRRFEVAPATITAFNNYLAAASVREGSLTAIMREQAKLHLQWRLARRVGSSAPMEASSSFLRAVPFDQNDLHSANVEFEHEIAVFESWLAKKAKGFSPVTQVPGFDNERENEWEEIATWWRKAAAPPQAVLTFFDEYVHDSRAWFKLIPFNPDNEDDARALLTRQAAALRIERERNAQQEKIFVEDQRGLSRTAGRKQNANAAKYHPPPGKFSAAQVKAIDEFSATGKIPRMMTEGREPFEAGPLVGIAGYLRYRKVYGGSDNDLLSSTDQAEAGLSRAA